MKPATLNEGWTYRDRVPQTDAGIALSAWLALRYRHSDGVLWQQRIAAGELELNGAVLSGDQQLQGGEILCWRRPPWLEEAIPDQWQTIHDDGDLLVINKTDLAPLVGADLGVMDRDAKKMRGDRPFLFTNLKAMDGLEDVKNFIIETGGLRQSAAS